MPPKKRKTPARKKRKTTAAEEEEPPAPAPAPAEAEKVATEDHRQVGGGSAGDVAAVVGQQQDQGGGNEKVAAAAAEAERAISRAYRECVEGDQLDERHVACSRYEREGLVATTLWPFLLSKQRQEDGNDSSNHTKQLVYQTCRLIVVLVSFSNSAAAGKKDNQALECMLSRPPSPPDGATAAAAAAEDGGGRGGDDDSWIAPSSAAWKRLLEAAYGPSAHFPAYGSQHRYYCAGADDYAREARGGGGSQPQNQETQQDQQEWEYLASLVHFMTLACGLAQQQQSLRIPLRDLLRPYNASDVTVLAQLPRRQREWLLRQHEGWLEEYERALSGSDELCGEKEKSKKTTQATATATSSPCFVVRLVRHVLHLIQGDALKLGKIRYSVDGNGGGKEGERREEDDGDDEEEEGRDDDSDDGDKDGVGDGDSTMKLDIEYTPQDEQQQEEEREAHRRVASSQYVFLHKSLELLIDLLHSLPTRRYLAPYLSAIHFGIYARRALGIPSNAMVGSTSGGGGTNGDQLWLAQQLVARVQSCLYVHTSTNASPHHPHGRVLDRVQQVALLHSRAALVQKMCHRYYPDKLGDLIYAGVGLLCRNAEDGSGGNGTPNSFLESALAALDDTQLLNLIQSKLRLLGEAEDDVTTYNGNGGPETYSRDFLIEVLQEFLTYPADLTRQQQSLPLYPNERLLWDTARIPPSLPSLVSTTVLASPKLQTQFLSSQDYLSRNFALMQASTAYDIRGDLVHVMARIRPIVAAPSQEDLDDDYSNSKKGALQTTFAGWARMALELDGTMRLVRVEKPRLMGLLPSRVLAEFAIDLTPCGATIRREWDALGEYDNLFLMAVDATRMTNAPAPLLSEYHLQHGSLRGDTDGDRRVPDEDDSTFPERFGIVLVRGCQIVHIRDEHGSILGSVNSEGAGEPTITTSLKGTKRIFRVELDPAQYAVDAKLSRGGASELYQSFNLVVRREGRENNFKAVLETIRGLMNGAANDGSMVGRVLPPWLESILLGQGNPAAADYKSETMRRYAKRTVGVANPEDPLDFGDTFVNEQHLRSSFPNVVVDGRKLSSKEGTAVASDRKNYRVRTLEKDGRAVVEATSYPFPENTPGNPVSFTPVQVEAIRSGLSPGLTVVVGPPGTGKTDVAVQIIACLFHSFPSQRTIVITHSNAALNDIFQKVMARGDVDERYLVRLGSGERDLETDSTHDFTKAGRVGFSLVRRGKLLEEVQLLSESLGLSGKAERGADGSPSYTCETAQYFQQHHIQKFIRSFERRVKNESFGNDADVSSFFPFGGYFKIEGGEKPITLPQARKYFGKLRAIFDELNEYRPFELLRSQKQRTDYLIMKQARVVAMTCTHAAIARSHLIELGFEYDNVVVEEAGQMTDIETFIPLLLQKGDGSANVVESSSSSGSSSRLKRICLMGDHNQLPPVIKNMSLAHYSNLDQSLFTRLIRFGVPHIQLDKQGRARPEIADLYRWRYDNLGDLDRVSGEGSPYLLANPGFVHTFQVINVDKFEGKGESTPTAYFFQNVGEAEYAVALFQYMVLIGYSPQKITILTTYNGQKALISDILSQRCGDGTPLAGVRPRTVSTVDQYQGQQNDYIILSLVRTESVGHLRDVRRLVVAVSRARLGLYVLCRRDLFASHHDLKRTFDQFAGRGSNKLRLVLGETFPTDRRAGADGEDDAVGIPKDKIFEVDDVTHLGSLVHQMQEDLMQ